MNHSKTNIKSIIFLFTAAIVWGFAFVAQKHGGSAIPAFYFNGTRFIIGAVSLIPVVLLFERETKDIKKLLRTMRAAAICACFLFVASALQQYGIVVTGDAGKSGFITSLYSVLVPVAYFLFFKKKTAANIWIGALLAITGIFLLSIKNDFTVEPGDLYLLAGTIFWASHIISVDKLVRDVSPIKFALFQALFCGIYNLCFAFPMETATAEGFGLALIPLLYCGIGSTAIAYTCQILGQKYATDQTYATIILSTESVFSVLGGVLVDKEVMAPRGYLGCVLIFAGVIIAQLVFDKKKKPQA